MKLLNSFQLIKGIGRPSMSCLLQTDASFFSKGGVAKTGAILFPENEFTVKEYRYMINSYHAEYQSVVDGLRFARYKSKPGVAVENDCAGVIASITSTTPPKHAYAEKCYREIEKIIEDFDWVAIRWIPRELNQADALLR